MSGVNQLSANPQTPWFVSSSVSTRNILYHLPRGQILSPRLRVIGATLAHGVVAPARQPICSLASGTTNLCQNRLYGGIHNVDYGSRRLAGRYDNLMPESTISLHSGTKNFATDSSYWLTGITYVQCTLGIWVLRTVYTYRYDQGDGISGHRGTTQPEMCY